MISTTDYFYPLVDDPYIQGMVGACNVLSDMYALGVLHIDNVLMILASSDRMDPDSRHIVTRKMIEGFCDLCKAAGVEVTGGQTVVNPWPIIGGCAMSCCSEDEYLYPVYAVPGDVLVLTKPLGTQIAVNVNEWLQLEDQTKWKKAQEVLTLSDAQHAYQTAVDSMITLNRDAARLMYKYEAHAATDVTGFGIIGHATTLSKNQKIPLNFVIHTLPIINKMEKVDKLFPHFRLLKGFSAETSGGLLIALPRTAAADYCREFASLGGFPSWIVGEVVSCNTSNNAADTKHNTAVLSSELKIVIVNVGGYTESKL